MHAISTFLIVLCFSSLPIAKIWAAIPQNLIVFFTNNLDTPQADTATTQLGQLQASKNTDGSISLYWQTIREVNCHYFTIERATDEGFFKEIATVYGAGNSAAPLAYTYIDILPVAGNNNYRVQCIGYEGDTVRTETIIVKGVDNADVIAYKDGNIMLELNQDAAVQIRIQTATGKVIAAQKTQMKAGDHVYPINLEYQNAGIYIANIVTPTNQMKFKLLKRY